jgi:hypothetical protein
VLYDVVDLDLWLSSYARIETGDAMQ